MPTPTRAASWKWWICGLLLLATMLNYMDRLTLNLMAKRIMDAFTLDERQYGYLESAFAFAFALGAIVFGWMADRWNVRWTYPVAVLAWSLAGFATGLVDGFVGLLVCRFLLGLTEAGHWPCALRTTQHVLPPSERSMGNSLLQSGAALGAILTPMIVLGLTRWTGTWRYPFLVIGALGICWVLVWVRNVRRDDLAVPANKQSSSLAVILAVLIPLLLLDLGVHIFAAEHAWLPLATKTFVTIAGISSVFLWLNNATREDTRLPRPVFMRRFAVLAVLVVTTNITWHFFRAWMPLFLQIQHGYSEDETSWFVTSYYVVTDVGCLTVGFITLWLTRHGFSVHGSRVAMFLACALLTSLSVIAAQLPPGPWLLALLLIIGFGALGLFPNYYSFSQELTVQFQGKVTGALGCTCWLSMALLHELVGDSIKRTGSYSQGVGLAGLAPLVGLVVLVVFWGKTQPQEDVAAEPPPVPVSIKEPVEERIQAPLAGQIQRSSS
jgi:ACS family hexuronate transporter-like MFS transporter